MLLLHPIIIFAVFASFQVISFVACDNGKTNSSKELKTVPYYRSALFYISNISTLIFFFFWQRN